MIIKTKMELFDNVLERVKELHSYEIPEIISFKIDKGYTKFFKWVDESII